MSYLVLVSSWSSKDRIEKLYLNKEIENMR